VAFAAQRVRPWARQPPPMLMAAEREAPSEHKRAAAHADADLPEAETAVASNATGVGAREQVSLCSYQCIVDTINLGHCVTCVGRLACTVNGSIFSTVASAREGQPCCCPQAALLSLEVRRKCQKSTVLLCSTA
jgi:hypothetical protein